MLLDRVEVPVTAIRVRRHIAEGLDTDLHIAKGIAVQEVVLRALQQHARLGREPLPFDEVADRGDIACLA